MIKRIVIFFIVFVVSMFIANKLLSTGGSDAIFIKLLISGLVASLAFWFITVWDNQEENTDHH